VSCEKPANAVSDNGKYQRILFLNVFLGEDTIVPAAFVCICRCFPTIDCLEYVGSYRQPFIAFTDCPKTCIRMIVKLIILVSLRR